MNGAREKLCNAIWFLAGPQVNGSLLGSGAGIGLRNIDPELKKMYNDAIMKAKEEGTLKTLRMKWFGQDITPQ